jgi:hypothetical protein
MDSFDADPAVSRLRSLASHPIDAAVARDHLQAMASVPFVAPVRSRFRMAMAGSLMAGALVGGAGIAAAATGHLPETAQAVAHDATLGLVPDGPRHKAADARENSRSGEDHGTARFVRGCTNPDGSAFTGNHGAYVKAHPDDPRTADVNEREVAAQSDCGKPQVSVDNRADTSTSDSGKSGEDHGKSADDHGRSADHKPAVTGNSTSASHDSGEVDHETTTTEKPDVENHSGSSHGSGSGSGSSGEGSGHRG